MSRQSPTANGPEQLPEAPHNQIENREVRSPDAPEDPVEGEAGDGLNPETGDGNPND